MNSRDRLVFDHLDLERLNAYLQHGMIPLQELDKAWHDSTLDNLFNWRVFLLGEQLPEFGCSIQLACRVIREDTLDHFIRQLLEEKKTKVRSRISLYRLS